MSDPRYYHAFTPNSYGVCLQFMGHDQCREHENSPVHQHKGVPFTELELRYRNDPVFHMVAHWMLNLIQYQEWSIQDLRDVVDVTERLHAERRDR